MQKLSLKATLVGRQFDLKQVQDLNGCEVLSPTQFFGEFACRRKLEPIGTHLQADMAEVVLSIYVQQDVPEDAFYVGVHINPENGKLTGGLEKGDRTWVVGEILEDTLMLGCSWRIYLARLANADVEKFDFEWAPSVNKDEFNELLERAGIVVLGEWSSPATGSS